MADFVYRFLASVRTMYNIPMFPPLSLVHTLEDKVWLRTAVGEHMLPCIYLQYKPQDVDPDDDIPTPPELHGHFKERKYLDKVDS